MGEKSSEKWIAIEAEIDEETIAVIKSIFPSHVLEEISQSDITNIMK